MLKVCSAHAMHICYIHPHTRAHMHIHTPHTRTHARSQRDPRRQLSENRRQMATIMAKMVSTSRGRKCGETLIRNRYVLICKKKNQICIFRTLNKILYIKNNLQICRCVFARVCGVFVCMTCVCDVFVQTCSNVSIFHYESPSHQLVVATVLEKKREETRREARRQTR